MGSRCHIAYIDRDGTGKGTYCHMGCYPDDVGITLLTCYQEEEQIKALVNLGWMSSLSPTVEITRKRINDYTPAYKIAGGTQEFFGRYMPSIEWLYAWTPDGWLAARGYRDPIPDHVYRLDAPEEHPAWALAELEAASYQEPQPLYNVIRDYLIERASSPPDQDSPAR